MTHSPSRPTSHRGLTIERQRSSAEESDALSQAETPPAASRATGREHGTSSILCPAAILPDPSRHNVSTEHQRVAGVERHRATARTSPGCSRPHRTRKRLAADRDPSGPRSHGGHTLQMCPAFLWRVSLADTNGLSEQVSELSTRWRTGVKAASARYSRDGTSCTLTGGGMATRTIARRSRGRWKDSHPR